MRKPVVPPIVPEEVNNVKHKQDGAGRAYLDELADLTVQNCCSVLPISVSRPCCGI